MAAFNNGLVKYPKNFTMCYQELVWARSPKLLNSASSYCCFRTFQTWPFSLQNNCVFFCRSSENILISDDTDVLMIPTYSFPAQTFSLRVNFISSNSYRIPGCRDFPGISDFDFACSQVNSYSCTNHGLLLLSHIHIQSVTKSYNFTCKICLESIIVILSALNQNSKCVFFGLGSFLTSTPLFSPLPTYPPHNCWWRQFK